MKRSDIQIAEPPTGISKLLGNGGRKSTSSLIATNGVVVYKIAGLSGALPSTMTTR